MIRFLFLIYASIPVFIFIRAITASDEVVRKCRCHYALPAFVLMIVNIICFYFLWMTDYIDLLNQVSAVLLFASICLYFVILFYKIGFRQEKDLLFQLASDIIQKYDA